MPSDLSGCRTRHQCVAATRITTEQCSISAPTFPRGVRATGCVASISLWLPAAALQFPFGHPAVASTIPGASTVEEITANVGYFEEEIPDVFWQQLVDEGLIDPASPLPA